jgi:hypothetical protein
LRCDAVPLATPVSDVRRLVGLMTDAALRRGPIGDQGRPGVSLESTKYVPGRYSLHTFSGPVRSRPLAASSLVTIKLLGIRSDQIGPDFEACENSRSVFARVEVLAFGTDSVEEVGLGAAGQFVDAVAFSS